MKWISVEDELPELKEEAVGYFCSDLVLCANIEAGGYMCAPEIWIFHLIKFPRDKKARWTNIGELYPGEVTHWMYLPDLPSKKENK